MQHRYRSGRIAQPVSPPVAVGPFPSSRSSFSASSRLLLAWASRRAGANPSSFAPPATSRGSGGSAGSRVDLAGELLRPAVGPQVDLGRRHPEDSEGRADLASMVG